MSPKLLSTIFGILGVVCTIAAFGLMGEKLLWTGIFGAGAVCWFVTAVVASVWPTDLRLVNVNGEHLWFAGTSRQFLSSLPAFATRHQMAAVRSVPASNVKRTKPAAG